MTCLFFVSLILEYLPCQQNGVRSRWERMRSCTQVRGIRRVGEILHVNWTWWWTRFGKWGREGLGGVPVLWVTGQIVVPFTKVAWVWGGKWRIWIWAGWVGDASENPGWSCPTQSGFWGLRAVGTPSPGMALASDSDDSENEMSQLGSNGVFCPVFPILTRPRGTMFQGSDSDHFPYFTSGNHPKSRSPYLLPSLNYLGCDQAIYPWHFTPKLLGEPY